MLELQYTHRAQWRNFNFLSKMITNFEIMWLHMAEIIFDEFCTLHDNRNL